MPDDDAARSVGDRDDGGEGAADGSGDAGVAPTPARDAPACATDGDETCTNRVTSARSAASSIVRVPSTFTAENSAASPASDTFAARCTTASAPATALATVAASVTEPSTSWAPATPLGRRCSVRTA